MRFRIFWRATQACALAFVLSMVCLAQNQGQDKQKEKEQQQEQQRQQQKAARKQEAQQSQQQQSQQRQQEKAQRQQQSQQAEQQRQQQKAQRQQGQQEAQQQTQQRQQQKAQRQQQAQQSEQQRQQQTQQSEQQRQQQRAQRQQQAQQQTQQQTQQREQQRTERQRADAQRQSQAGRQTTVEEQRRELERRQAQVRDPERERRERALGQQRLVRFRSDHERWEREAQIRRNILERDHRLNRLRFQETYLERLREDQRRLSGWQYVYAPPLFRYSRSGRYYNVNQYGADMLRQAVQFGYDEGVRAGQADRQDHWRFAYNDSLAYQEGAFGYAAGYVDLPEYRYYFREGFRRGYEDGYYGRYRYGSEGGGTFSILGNILDQILNFRHL